MAYLQCFTTNPTVRVTSGYPYYPGGGYHGACDMVLSPDTTIHAIASGTIVRAWHWQGTRTGTDSWGNHIVVQMGPYEYWLCAHMASQLWSAGQTVTAGDAIGTQGETGNAYGKHVHWEHWVGGFGTKFRTDPFPLLGIPNAVGTYDVEWSGEGGSNVPTPASGITFSPPPGTYNLPIDVSISAMWQGTIYYSIDGTYPSLDDPVYTHEYTGPVHLLMGDTQFIVGVYNPTLPPEQQWSEWGIARYKVLEDEEAKRKRLKGMPLYMKMWWP